LILHFCSTIAKNYYEKELKRGAMMPKNGSDVVIIGSGPAGLAAAIKAKETGVRDVVLIERGEQLGGLLHQCVHNGFGLFYFKEDMTGPEYAHRFIEKVNDLKINLLLETMVLDITPDRRVTLCNKGGLFTFQPKAVVLAMGCRERSRQSIMIPGTRPAGVFTAGTAQRIVNVEGYLPGKEIVILGSGDVGMIMARRLTLEGAEVKAVVEILPYIGGLIRNEVQCLHDFSIPLFLEHTVTEVHGPQRVEAVTIAKVDKEAEPIPGTERKIECDTLLLSVGLIPENELSLKAGVELDPITGGPLVNEMMETNVSGIFAAGNVVHVNDLVDNVTLEGEAAGQCAAEYAMGRVIPAKQKISLMPGENIRYVVPHSIAGEKEVTLRMRVKEPKEKVTLKIGDILTQSLRVVKPGEMVNVQLSKDQLGRIGKRATELVVSCEKRG
jgi:NADPH-dependent 2,4-dienoyl-CoA reductase/sulfur reductase-like enzyme